MRQLHGDGIDVTKVTAVLRLIAVFVHQKLYSVLGVRGLSQYLYTRSADSVITEGAEVSFVAKKKIHA